MQPLNSSLHMLLCRLPCPELPRTSESNKGTDYFYPSLIFRCVVGGSLTNSLPHS